MWEIIYKNDLILTDLLAMPELDEYRYNGKVSYVCSSLVVDILRAGDLFGDLKINAAEFTPKDLI